MFASRAGGTIHDAPASSEIDQMASSDAESAAHEFGGGGSGMTPLIAPAMMVTTAARPAESVSRSLGICGSHSIVKYGSTILDFAGRFSQI